jgi:bacillolysin
MKYFKHLFLFIATTLFAITALAQQESFITNDTSSNGTVRFRRYNVSLNPQPAASEKELLKSILGISVDDSLGMATIRNDSLGFTHKFYLQYYKGIKVEYSSYSTHIRNGIIEVVNGEFAKVGNPATAASIDETKALTYALKYINAQLYKWQVPGEENALKELKKDSSATYYPKGEIVICYDYMQTKTYRLAYKFIICSYLPVSSSNIYVDAITGSIIAQQNLLLDVNVVTTVATKYSGSQTITTDQYLVGGTTTFRLQEVRGNSNVAIQSFNSQRTQSTAHTDFTDLTNTWTASNNANMDNAALDAHWASEKIYDYWNTIRGRNSYDGTADPMISFVHYNIPQIINGIPVYPTGTDNSQWDLNLHQVYLGDGLTIFKPLTSFDICSHEFGHGFTEFAQNPIHILSLNYETSETGALNEGISDIWGAVVENWGTTGKQTWEIGEDAMKDGYPCLRSLQNPKTGGDPTGITEFTLKSHPENLILFSSASSG